MRTVGPITVPNEVNRNWTGLHHRTAVIGNSITGNDRSCDRSLFLGSLFFRPIFVFVCPTFTGGRQVRGVANGLRSQKVDCKKDEQYCKQRPYLTEGSCHSQTPHNIGICFESDEDQNQEEAR